MENETKAKEIKEDKDSLTYGTAAKGGAVKIYFNMQTMTDEEVLALCSRAKDLFERTQIGGN